MAGTFPVYGFAGSQWIQGFVMAPQVRATCASTEVLTSEQSLAAKRRKRLQNAPLPKPQRTQQQAKWRLCNQKLSKKDVEKVLAHEVADGISKQLRHDSLWDLSPLHEDVWWKNQRVDFEEWVSEADTEPDADEAPSANDETDNEDGDEWWQEHNLDLVIANIYQRNGLADLYQGSQLPTASAEAPEELESHESFRDVLTSTASCQEESMDGAGASAALGEDERDSEVEHGASSMGPALAPSIVVVSDAEAHDARQDSAASTPDWPEWEDDWALDEKVGGLAATDDQDSPRGASVAETLLHKEMKSKAKHSSMEEEEEEEWEALALTLESDCCVVDLKDTVKHADQSPTHASAEKATCSSSASDASDAKTRHNGVVKWFRGSYGWIESVSVSKKHRGQDVFLHKVDCDCMPKWGDRVTFCLSVDEKGNPKAVEARVAKPKVMISGRDWFANREVAKKL